MDPTGLNTVSYAVAMPWLLESLINFEYIYVYFAINVYTLSTFCVLYLLPPMTTALTSSLMCAAAAAYEDNTIIIIRVFLCELKQ